MDDNILESEKSDVSISKSVKKNRNLAMTSLNPDNEIDIQAAIMQNMGDPDDDLMNKQIFNQHPSKFFENLVLTLIVLSGIAMMVDNPLDDPEGKVQEIL
jgi:hypothetical protein